MQTSERRHCKWLFVWKVRQNFAILMQPHILLRRRSYLLYTGLKHRAVFIFSFLVKVLCIDLFYHFRQEDL